MFQLRSLRSAVEWMEQFWFVVVSREVNFWLALIHRTLADYQGGWEAWAGKPPQFGYRRSCWFTKADGGPMCVTDQLGGEKLMHHLTEEMASTLHLKE